ncbi:MAG: CoA transferase [Burkholderiaceae bacterium]
MTGLAAPGAIPNAPLHSLRVVEFGTLPAASYCARLCADFGAAVVHVEPPGGDPDRAAAPLIGDGAGQPVSGWFAFLNVGKQSLVVDPGDPAQLARLDALLASADLIVDGSDAAMRAAWRLDTARLAAMPDGPVVVDVSWFGRDGPYAEYAGSDAVCRALAGLVELIGPVEGPPLTLPDYQAAITAGLAAFVPLMASVLARTPHAGADRDARRADEQQFDRQQIDGQQIDRQQIDRQRADRQQVDARRADERASREPPPRGGERWELSVFEASIALCEFQTSEAYATGIPQGRRGFNRFTPTYPMAIYRCREGWLGLTIVTPAQWASLCEMVGLPESMIDDPAYLPSGPLRLMHADTLEPMLRERFLARTAGEWFERGLALRLPLAIVPDMAGLLRTKVFRDRGMFVPIDVGGRTIEGPGSPMNLRDCPPRRGGGVPSPDAHDPSLFEPRTDRRFASRPARPAGADAYDPMLPLAGVTIVDLSMGWAGPLCTRHMADLGADVIKVEACGYADWWRGVSSNPADFEARVYEKQPRFNIMNRNKRAITLDLTSAEGVRLLKELVRDADAVVENYSSSVLKKLGLDYAALREVNPSLVMVSMAAYGSGNEWSEARAYGSTLEQGSGLPSAAGRDGDPPMMNHIAYGDAVGGLNGAGALLVGLVHRRSTGRGQHVDISQIECMLPYVAPWIVEQSANGAVAPRLGNRHPDHWPQGIYRCAGDDDWLLVTVIDDGGWRALCGVIEPAGAGSLAGSASLAGDASLATAAGRRAAIDRIDVAIEAWTSRLAPDEAMRRLQAVGVPAGVVRAPIAVVDDPHLVARGFWPLVDRPYIGTQPQPLAPYRLDGKALPVRRAAPTLGQHNEEILGGRLGLDDAALRRLREAGVIGTEARMPANARPRHFGRQAAEARG